MRFVIGLEWTHAYHTAKWMSSQLCVCVCVCLKECNKFHRIYVLRTREGHSGARVCGLKMYALIIRIDSDENFILQFSL